MGQPSHLALLEKSFSEENYSNVIGIIKQNNALINNESISPKILAMWEFIFSSNMTANVVIQTLSLITDLYLASDFNVYRNSLPKVSIISKYNFSSLYDNLTPNNMELCKRFFLEVLKESPNNPYQLSNLSEDSSMVKFINDVIIHHIHRLPDKDQIKYGTKLASPGAIDRLTPLVDRIIKNIIFSNSIFSKPPYNSGNLKLNILVVGCGRVGKSTLINEIFGNRIPPGEKLRENAGDSGEVTLRSLKYTGIRPVKDLEKDNFPGKQQLNITVEMTDSGGFIHFPQVAMSKEHKKDLNKKQSNLWDQLTKEILKQAYKGNPYHMVLYCVRDDFIFSDAIYCKTFGGMKLPVILVCTKYIEQKCLLPDGGVTRSIRKHKCNDVINRTVGIISREIDTGTEEKPDFVGPRNMIQLVDYICEIFFKFSVNAIKESHENRQMLTNGDYDGLRRKANIAVYGFVATIATGTAVMPPVIDAAYAIATISSMIVTVSMIYGISFYREWSFWARIISALPAGLLAFVVGGGGMTLGAFLEFTVVGYVIGAAVEFVVIGILSLWIGKSLVNTYDALARDNMIKENGEIDEEVLKDYFEKNHEGISSIISEYIRQYGNIDDDQNP